MKTLIVEFYLHSGSEEIVLRLKSRGGFAGKVDGEVVKVFPGLVTPISFGTKISAEQYGVKLRGNGINSDIGFGLTEALWEYLDYHWKGRVVKILEGEIDEEYSSFDVIFFGRIVDLTFDVIKSSATVKITDESFNLNVPLVTEVYRSVPGVLDIENLTGVLEKEISESTILTPVESTSPGIDFVGILESNAVITFAAGFTGIVQVVNNTTGGWNLICGLAGGSNVIVGYGSGAALFCDGKDFILADGSETQATLTSLIGLPKPKLRGQVFSAKPVMEYDGVSYQIWRLSTEPLDSIDNVEVGGIAWRKVETVPRSGEWRDLKNGTFQLGSVTLGSEVRCDAKGVGWETLTTGELVKQLVEEKGYSVDQDFIDSVNVNAPQLIGLYTDTTAVNFLDAIDNITANVIGWWTFGFNDHFQIGVIAEPDSEGMMLLDEGNIQSLNLNGLDPPAWRIRVRFKPNWNPLSNALPGLSETEAFVKKERGFIAENYNNQAILDIEPQAVDVPIIESFVVLENDAKSIRDRAVDAWSVKRKIYDITIIGDEVPEFYDTVEVSYKAISGFFRVIGITKSKEGGNHSIQVWGSGNIFV